MKDQQEKARGSGCVVLRTESDFFEHIESRMEQQGFEVLDLFGSNQGEGQSPPLVFPEGA